MSALVEVERFEGEPPPVHRLRPARHRRMSAPGPLAGLRVLEIAGVGPGPHCAMLLADMGAGCTAHRPGAGALPRPCAHRPAEPRPPLRRTRSQAAPRGRGGARAGGNGRRVAGGLPAGRDGTARPRAGTRARAQSEARLCAADRLGAGGAAGAGGGSRPQLSGADGRAARHRPGLRPARAATQSRRRLRRRRALCRLRHSGSPVRAGTLGPGTNRRCRHGGRRGLADDLRAGAGRSRLVAGRARGEPDRRRGALLPLLRDPGRQVGRARRYRAGVLRRLPEADRPRR